MGKGEPNFKWRTPGYLLRDGRFGAGSYIRDTLGTDNGGRGEEWTVSQRDEPVTNYLRVVFRADPQVSPTLSSDIACLYFTRFVEVPCSTSKTSTSFIWFQHPLAFQGLGLIDLFRFDSPTCLWIQPHLMNEQSLEINLPELMPKSLIILSPTNNNIQVKLTWTLKVRQKKWEVFFFTLTEGITFYNFY